MEPKQEIEQLTRELEHAGYLYYVLDNPEMSDYDYDHKLRRLEELEAQYPQYASPLSPTRRVGGQALSEFVKVRHAVPLESLQDVFSYDELRDFDAHVREEEPDAEYSVEPKVDGLSVALEYVDGVREAVDYAYLANFAKLVNLAIEHRGAFCQEAFEKNLRTIFDMMLDYLSGNTDNGKGTC